MRQFVVVLLSLLCLPSIAQTFTQSCSHPLFPSSTATDIDSACGTDGNGGNETNQNTAKNNFCATAIPRPITFTKLNMLQTQVQNTKSINFGDKNEATRRAGPTKDRTKLESMGEGNPVVLKGYVLIARQEGGESVNCGKKVDDEDLDHDIHISIVETADQKDECKSVVVEMIPHHRPADWTADNVKLLAPRKHLVRVTGQLMFDSSHVTCSQDQKVRKNPMRSSLWEIHPI